MKATRSRRDEGATPETSQWPRRVTEGRESVTVYRRKTPSGNFAFMLANYAEGAGKRRFDSYADEPTAIAEAKKLAKRLNARHIKAGLITEKQAEEFFAAREELEAHGVCVREAARVVSDCLDVVGSLSKLREAAEFFALRHRQVVAKRVPEVVKELLTVKGSRGASLRYLQDLRYRLNRFADSFQVDASKVGSAEVQEWLDRQKLAAQGYTNFRRVLQLLFEFAVARGYASDNPVDRVERVKVRNGDVEIFTPTEISRLLAAASDEFLPCIAIGAFAGLRSAEIERLEWADIDLTARHIVLSAARAKTASRRIVPISENLAQWLAPYAGRRGKVWPGTHDEFYDAQQITAANTAVLGDAGNAIKAMPAISWKPNALRHSYASYRFAQTGDAGRVAGELGNSAAVVHRHYRELVKPADAERWFAVVPASPANLIPIPSAAAK